MDKLGQLIADGVDVYDLAQPYFTGNPAHPATAGFRMTMQTRHGDAVTETGKSSAHELIVMGSHVGTHIDALGHVSQDGLLYGGADAYEVQQGGILASHGVEEIEPIVARGVLLDVAAAKGVDQLPGDTPISSSDLQEAADFGGVEIRAGDVVLVRIGWASNYSDNERFLGLSSGVPGPTEEASYWLADKGIRATGGETLSYEYLKPGLGTNGGIPVHRVLLVEKAIPIIEVMNLQRLSDARVYEFTFVLAALNFVGSSGAACRPLALVSGAG